MDDRETRRLEMFLRVRQFGAARASAFPAGSRGAEVLALVDASITELENHATAQASGASGAREATALKAAAREAVREDLEAISRTARVMAQTTPGLEDKFRLPRSNGTQALLTAARSFALDAEPMKAEFIRRGLPADFLEDLAADIETLADVVNRRELKSAARVAAGAAIDEAVERGVNAVRELDAIVRNVFRNDAATLAEWTTTSHTVRQPRRQSNEPPAPPPPAPPA